MNPFLHKFDTPHSTIPFDKIKNEYFMEALDILIEKRLAVMSEIKSNSETPTFDNVLVKMEEEGERLLESVALAFSNLNSAETNDEMQEIAKEFYPKLTDHENDITLDEGLFKKVKSVYDNKNSFNLNTEQKTLLDKMYKGFVRNGANLNNEDKQKLRDIDSELSKISVQFSENALKETNAYELHLTDEKDLSGLPESAKDAAKITAKEKEKEGWVFTLQMPSLIPFMQYADNRELRKKLVLAHSSKCAHGGDTDNKENVKRIVNLKHQRANLLGYETHANFVLEERMAQNPKRVHEFLNEILEYAKPAADKDMKELGEYAKKLGGPEVIEMWDYAYYSEKLKLEKYSIDDEMLRPYFKLENVIDGVFGVAEKLYGIKFNEVSNIPVYHKDVKTFEVVDSDGSFVGVFYADFFPRKGKRSGAWMTYYRGQATIKGVDERPHISIVCNFTKPTEDKPSLITFNEVSTLFHEFGHALHGLLAKGTYISLAGVNVFWDFVELPSQIMENWTFEKECLDMFAEHYETGDKIPEDYIKKIKDSANFHGGRNTVRQLSFAMLDMGWHGQDPTSITDVEKFEKEIISKTRVSPDVPGTCMSPSFSHIFTGGYSAGYYSYKWAEVLDADAFEYFKENGIFNKEISMKFRNEVLSKGGTDHPATLYKNFRGRDPEIRPLLKRSGLIK